MTANITFTVSVADESLPVAAMIRRHAADLVLMLHGLGCAKESFAGAFGSPVLAGYSICAIDLPGHGRSGSPPSDVGIDELAEAVVGVASQLEYERLHLVCHSLGGAVGLLAANEVAGLTSFVNIEGNMVPGDCGIVSRRTAAQNTQEFVSSGFLAFVAGLRASPDPSSRRWASWYEACDRRAIHSIARSLVEISDSSKLLGVFTGLHNASYVHGDRSDVAHLLPLLDGEDLHVIPGSGHFPMIDNPAALWDVLGSVLARTRVPDRVNG